MQEEVCHLCEGVSERIVAEVLNFAQRVGEHSATQLRTAARHETELTRSLTSAACQGSADYGPERCFFLCSLRYSTVVRPASTSNRMSVPDLQQMFDTTCCQALAGASLQAAGFAT